MTETAKDAAKRLAAPILAKGFKPQARHVYRDTEGTEIFSRIRAKHPETGEKWIRPMYRNGHGYQIGEPKWEGPKPIYNLDRIAKAPADAPIFVVEGEWAADKLTPLGIINTTSGGADSADRADWTPLKGRKCIVWRDLDEPGRIYAEAVSDRLRPLGCAVEWIDVESLGLPAKGDAVDWLAAHPKATAAEVLALPRVGARQSTQTPASTSEAQPSPRSGLASFAPARPSAREEWPEALAEEAYYGLAGDIVRAIEPHTESDPAAILLQVLVMFGALVGRGPHVRVEGDEHHSNLFANLVGRSSKARKGTSQGRVLTIFQPIEGFPRKVEGLSSGEGLKYAVRDPVRKIEKDKAGFACEVEIDAGVADKRLLVTESEFAQVLRQCARPGNTLSATIRSAWDKGDLQTLTKNDPVTATGAHICMIGHITSDELRAELTATDSANGFANRILFMAVERSKRLPFGGEGLRPDVAADLSSRVARAAALARTRGAMPWSAQARAAWESVYAVLSEGHSGLFGAVTARAEAQTLRLALIYALMDEAAAIDLPHLQAALAVWERCEASARYIFGSAIGDRIADAILRALSASTDRRMTRTQISGLFSRNEAAERIGAALAILEQRGLARCGKAEGPGRPAEVWEAL